MIVRFVNLDMRIEEIELGSALPESHNVAVPNLFGCTTPRFGVLSGNTPDADLSQVSKVIHVNHVQIRRR